MRFCDECKSSTSDDGIRQHNHVSTDAYDAELDALRKGTRWQSIRRSVIYRDPLCRRCQLRVSEIVDHIVPAKEAIRQVRESKRYTYDRYAGYYLRSNLQGLCRPCHGAKTVEDKAHIGEWPSVVDAEDRAPKESLYLLVVKRGG